MRKNIVSQKTFCLIILITFLCAPVFIQAQTDPNTWTKLNLSSTIIDGTKIYYEKSFEPNLPLFKKMYDQFLAEKSIIDSILSKKNQILSDINNILGIEDPNILTQDRILSQLLSAFSSLEIKPLYIVKKSTIKDFLDSGGQLPKISYDKANDYVGYEFNIELTDKNYSPKVLEFIFVIKSPEVFETNVQEQFNVLQLLLGNLCSSTIIHEIVEMCLLKLARPGDPYWRWFSDGVSNIVTYEIMKKYIGTQEAEDFIKLFDANQYRDLQKEINLRYWMIANYCLLTGDLPTDAGKRLNNARYAYATFEARRLINEHGIECIAMILNKISSQQSRTGSELLEIIKNVTGEDMDARLDAYQDFEQKEEGIEKYGKIFNDARIKKDYEQMVTNLFRLHDLRFPSDMEQFFHDYHSAAAPLFKIGYEKEADMIMKNSIDLFSNPGLPGGKKAAIEVFALYAIETGNPRKAQKFTEELLKTEPDNGLALTINMLIHLSDNQLSQAKELAKKIISLSKSKETPAYQIATQILAIDPNQVKSLQ